MRELNAKYNDTNMAENLRKMADKLEKGEKVNLLALVGGVLATEYYESPAEDYTTGQALLIQNLMGTIGGMVPLCRLIVRVGGFLLKYSEITPGIDRDEVFIASAIPMVLCYGTPDQVEELAIKSEGIRKLAKEAAGSLANSVREKIQEAADVSIEQLFRVSGVVDPEDVSDQTVSDRDVDTKTDNSQGEEK